MIIGKRLDFPCCETTTLVSGAAAHVRDVGQRLRVGGDEGRRLGVGRQRRQLEPQRVEVPGVGRI